MGRRRHPIKSSFSFLDYLPILEKVLVILIAIFLFIFIFSAIRVKKSTFSPNNSNNYEEISEANVNNDILVSEENVTNNLNTNSTSSEIKKEEKKDTTINMAFTGDIMCHNTIYKDAYNSSTNEYDFSYIFDEIKHYLQIPDITVGNLETTFSGKDAGYSSYPTFNTPEALAYNLKKLGFDVVSTANNHCYDIGYSGIESTINYLNDADIAHTGTYTSEEDQNKILVQNVKGLKIAFLSFTYGTNGITVPQDKSYSVNLNDNPTILKQLQLAKEQTPDLICVSMHWGTEYQTSPNSSQQEMADFLFKNGADIIIGNHPHVLQSMEKREIKLEDGSSKDGFVVYSLGNFLADQNKNFTRSSAILNLSITKSVENKISINSATYIPFYIYRDTKKESQKFRLIDLKSTIEAYNSAYNSNISKSLYNTFNTELNNIKKLLGEEIKNN